MARKIYPGAVEDLRSEYTRRQRHVSAEIRSEGVRAPFETNDLPLLLGARLQAPLRMPESRVDGLAEEAWLASVPHNRAQEAEIGSWQRAAVNRYYARRLARQTCDRVRIAGVRIVHTNDLELQIV